MKLEQWERVSLRIHQFKGGTGHACDVRAEDGQTTIIIALIGFVEIDR
jgi:hypothetical protein